MTLFIGDVHGKFEQYKQIIKGQTGTIQVGDMGVGFRRLSGYRAGEYTQNPPHQAMLSGNHRFIRGNHDNPGVCKTHSQYIEDGCIEDDTMFIGGALSIDKKWRVPDYTWWADEELHQNELDSLLSVYLKEKPKVMVTHECPEMIAQMIVSHTTGCWVEKLEFPSITRQAFQSMIEGHKPKLWIFGHWHTSFDIEYDNTRFVCLNELETKEFDLKSL